ncbi:hypothetical protein BD410DRAFT_775208 [Rickenella mellea]|uniref:Uncharacterized protein n=1 Tax=Rickenella mellea TaxID=50990 RepID=A0A4Y7PRW7_9AGAM|nr:hypothetical protein BD410DRAFT_775208 [Rickenella mellea]
MPSRHYGPRQLFPTNATSTIYREYDRHPKLTGYRLLLISLTLAFGISKAITSYQGLSFAPTTLEWIFGVVVGIALYWIGLYEDVSTHPIAWLFQTDYYGSVALLLHFLFLALSALSILGFFAFAIPTTIFASTVSWWEFGPDSPGMVVLFKLSAFVVFSIVVGGFCMYVAYIAVCPVVGAIARVLTS